MHPTPSNMKKAKEMLDECLNWFKLSSNFLYEKNVGPTSSNIVHKRIQHGLFNMLDDVGLVFPNLNK